jgi:hypothetical protein
MAVTMKSNIFWDVMPCSLMKLTDDLEEHLKLLPVYRAPLSIRQWIYHTATTLHNDFANI